jgi:hypothetical protein
MSWNGARIAWDLLESPPRAFYNQLLAAIHAGREHHTGLRRRALAILEEEFGGRRACDLADDELKWLNGKLLALLRSRGLVPPVRRPRGEEDR